MDAFDAVRTVLATRGYTDKPVPADLVSRIVEAGRLTGSSQNKQPWHFLVVQNRDTLQELGNLASSGRYIAEAPLAIVILINDSPPAISDASRAIQSMVLTAWAEGVGSNWVGVRGEKGKATPIKTLLGIPPELEIAALLPFGYPTEPGGKGQKNRKPLAEVASSERYGQPFTAT